MVEAEEDRVVRARAEAMRAEIEVLRGAVSALRATRRSIGSSAIGEVKAERARARLALVIGAFAAGALVTLTIVSLYRAVLCP
jgi:hypothetical protein